jgi:hypothetical protein
MKSGIVLMIVGALLVIATLIYFGVVVSPSIKNADAQTQQQAITNVEIIAVVGIILFLIGLGIQKA